MGNTKEPRGTREQALEKALRDVLTLLAVVGPAHACSDHDGESCPVSAARAALALPVETTDRLSSPIGNAPTLTNLRLIEALAKSATFLCDCVEKAGCKSLASLTNQVRRDAKAV